MCKLSSRVNRFYFIPLHALLRRKLNCFAEMGLEESSKTQGRLVKQWLGLEESSKTQGRLVKQWLGLEESSKTQGRLVKQWLKNEAKCCFTPKYIMSLSFQANWDIG